MKCFYHSADLDGHCSGAIVKYRYPDCQMFPINYGDIFPWDNIEKDEEIYIVDFSLPFDDMKKLSEMANVIWIDHHNTALKEMREAGLTLAGLQREGDGGCELTWEYLFPQKKMPVAVRLLGRWDVWDHGATPAVIPFQYGMRLFDSNPENEPFWHTLFASNNGHINSIIESGVKIVQYEDQENKKLCKAACFEVEFAGYKFIALNKIMTSSKVFDSVWDPEKYDGMMVFGLRKGNWKFSIYNPDLKKSNLHCGQVAKKYGGGGHPGAAGFEVDELPFAISASKTKIMGD